MINLFITLYSAINGIDPSLSFQMARIESNMNPLALSRTDDGGLFQLNRKVHKFHNGNWIFNSTTNTAIAMNVLGKLKTTCKHKAKNSYVICYNIGVYGAGKIKNPFKQTYYRKMNLVWRH
jgi:soluble lytic murein transglycosylase-like protein